MTRKRAKKTEKAPKFLAPRDKDERSALRAKLNKRWPHPPGTPVTYTAKGEDPVATTTRTLSHYAGSGKVVVKLDGIFGSVPVLHLKVAS